jgi:DNA (cytosine-5)-methyltransferase 1
MSAALEASFRYIDLFAGIGGFAAALEAFGGECVYSVEIDEAASKVYERNWGHSPLGDITKDANDDVMNVPAHDILAAGFPCQPFSKSGAQGGMDETRGTLYWNILKIVEAHHPTIVLLENVRNLAGPRHKHEWDLIIQTLREQGYRVSRTPTVFSPHLLPLERGGRPQVRERVFITATYDPDGILDGIEPDPVLANVSLRGDEEWDLLADLPIDLDRGAAGTALTDDETAWLDAWNDFVVTMWAEVRKANGVGDAAALPGFPIWAGHWVKAEDLHRWIDGGRSPYRAADIPTTWDAVPAWKQTFLLKNARFYTRYKAQLDEWAARHDVASFPPSRQKLEWQAQQTKTLWDCVLQMRPSGIRAKRPTHVPALVAITQTSIVGPLRRRLTPREAARLQGFPDNFDFGGQSAAATYKQLGNGVNVGAVWNVLRAHAERDATILRTTAQGAALLKALVDDAPKNPDDRLPGAVAKGQSRAAESRLVITT